MSVLPEQPPPGEASFDFVQKGAARRKWVRRRKGISKARALTVSHISPCNVLPREAAGTSPPFQRLRKRPTSCQNTSQKGWGHPRRRPGQICCNHFSSQISIVLESIFIWYLQTQRGKKNWGRILIPIADCWGFWYNLWVPQSTQNIFLVQRYL